MSEIIKGDLTVVGAGYAGLCASIAAARHGLRVLLINDRDVPGGNASSEHRVHVNGGAVGNSTFYGREAGIADELKMYTFHSNPYYNKKQESHRSDMALLDKILSEPNINYYPGTVVYDCECEDNRIKRVFAVKPKTQCQYIFESPLYCDASGDGIVAYRSGAEYRVGREARSEFNESLAPETADRGVMGSCALFTVKHMGHPVKFTKPSFAYDLIADGKLKYFDNPKTGRRMPITADEYNGLWWLEFGGLNDTIKDADEIDLELRKLIYGYWDHIKNSGNYPDAEDMIIDWVAPYASKRESRRFIGEYIMTQSDIQSSRDFDDAVSTGGWSLDIHDVGGIYGTENTSAFGEVKSLYNIPLSIMYSKDIKNLFLGGRIVSCTHVALGSIRVMQTLGAMGQAVGTAAALCKKYGKLPTDIRHQHITELQDILQRDGQYILGKTEDCGLAKTAKIVASSVKLLENTADDSEYLLDKRLLYSLPFTENFSGKFSVRLKNNADQPTVCKYKVYAEESIRSEILGEMLLQNKVTVPENFDGYLTLPINIVTDSNKIYIELSPNTDLSAFGSVSKITGAPGAFDWVPNAKTEDSVSFCFKDFETDPMLYSADNIINGYSRPFGAPNCWVSDGKDEQWLELRFDEPTDISNIQIYFNAQFETDHFDRPIKQLITDYKLTVFSDSGVYEQTVSDNYCARNSFDLDIAKATKIRFDFVSNNGADNFEVFAVKVF